MTVLDRLLERAGLVRTSTLKARRGPRFPPLGAVAQHGQWNLPDLSLFENQLKTYEVFSTVFRAVRMIAEASCIVPLNVYRFAGDERAAEHNHEFERLLRRPNPVLTDVALLQSTFAFLELTGNAYWYVAYDAGRKPAEIWLMRPDRVTPVPHPTEFISGYIYTVDGTDIPLEVEDVVPFHRFHPRDDYMGLSAIGALAYQLQGDQAAVRWNTNFFGQDRAIPAGVVNVKDWVDDATYDRMQEEWRSSYGGTQRKTAFIRGGVVEWQSIGLPQEDMQFLEGRKFTLDEVMGAFGIPPGKYLESATEANAIVAERTFKQDTLWPKLVGVARQITHSLIVPIYGENYIVEFEDIRPQDKEQWLAEWSGVCKGTMGPAGMPVPLMTPKEIRERYFDMEPMIREEMGGGAEEQGSTGEGEEAGEEAEEREKWQRKALNALRRGKAAAVDFETALIPPEERLAIEQALSEATTAEEVRAAFAVGPFRGWQRYP